MEAEVSVMQLLALQVEGGHEPRIVVSLQKLEKVRKHSHLATPEGMQPCQHLDFSPMTPISNF